VPKRAVELGPLAVQRLKGPGLHFVGGVAGLALQITDAGSRSWILRMTVGGRRRDMGLGAYPDVTLAMAREDAKKARADVRKGVDPIEDRRAAQSALRASTAAALTFRQAAEAYMTAHAPTWRSAKHAQQWRNTLEAYAYPVLGNLLVRDVAKGARSGRAAPDLDDQERNGEQAAQSHGAGAGLRHAGGLPARRAEPCALAWGARQAVAEAREGRQGRASPGTAFAGGWRVHGAAAR
jgi:hypothetical protein